MSAPPSSPAFPAPGAGQGSAREDDAAELLERAGRGERSALMALYDRYASVLMAVAVRIAGSHAEAEEVLQDAFTRAWLEAPSYQRSRGTAVAWLVALTRNRAIDVVRSRGRRTNYESESFEAPSEPGPTPEHEVSDAERAHAVRLALASLTDEQRRALDLAYFGGLSHSEIAERLGQPLGTVKTRIAQAVRRLREELSRFAPNAAGSG